MFVYSLKKPFRCMNISRVCFIMQDSRSTCVKRAHGGAEKVCSSRKVTFLSPAAAPPSSQQKTINHA